MKICFQEMDHPFKLLEKKEGHLYEMVQQAGPEMAQILTKMSEKVSFFLNNCKVIEK